MACANGRTDPNGMKYLTLMEKGNAMAWNYSKKKKTVLTKSK